jgi:uncharacterized protein YrrD
VLAGDGTVNGYRPIQRLLLPQLSERYHDSPDDAFDLRIVDSEMQSKTAGEQIQMLRSAENLKGFEIGATDGEIGTIDQFYFDDEAWVIRYFIVETGGWLGGRQILISPISVIRADWQARRLDVALTKKQVENSPNIDTHRPVSRQHETAYLGYYGYPNYWGHPALRSPTSFPLPAPPPTPASEKALADRIQGESTDSHLRSSKEVTGYHIEATEGEIGHVEGFIVDDESWTIRYIEVATRNWWPGKKVLISPAWIQRVGWITSKIFVGLSRGAIKNGPEFVESTPITREYEERLYQHYGQAPYWHAV